MPIFITIVYSVILSFISNSFTFIKQAPKSLFVIIPLFLLINVFAGIFSIKSKSKKIKICFHGTSLLICFYISVITSVVCHVILGINTIPDDYMTFVWSAVICFAVNFIVFWNGIICVYLTSTQLGIKIRFVGLICGMIPVANLVALFFIIKTTAKECFFEQTKEQLNRQRANEKLCATNYPILLVHGVFFRDSKFFNYWGRIPKELETNGATIYYGNHPSAASVAESAQFLKERILQILEKTGAEKLNIIAHSKGGLDCRYAISNLGIADKVASLTTINTPHNGCLFADYLLNKISLNVKNKVANTYNNALKNFGEEADFLAAVNDLTDSALKDLNPKMPTPEGIYTQSVGTVLKRATSGKFPLNFSYHLVKHFSGENDGLVSEDSFKWGENYILLRPNGKRGISHGDIIDLNRENINGFDVREFYVNLVNGLKAKGL
jgi:triacylglycerol lipase